MHLKRQKKASETKRNPMQKPCFKIGINGFGRIGRLFFRLGFGKLPIIAINSPADEGMSAHLLKYDSVHGKWDPEALPLKGALNVGGQKIHYSKEKDPAKIPWRDFGVNMVVECSGRFKKREELESLLSPSVQKVIIGAPSKAADLTVVFSVNHNRYDKERHRLISLSSCTTNCTAPLLKILHENFSLERGFITTVHSYTNDQRLLDSSHQSDYRRARAAAHNIIPTSTGAGEALGLVLPELQGKIKGFALRVPTVNVSVLDLCLQTEKPLESVLDIRRILREEIKGRFNGIAALEAAPLVSSDFTGRTESAIVDSPSIGIHDGCFIKMLAWYDNEAGFAQRLVDFVQYMETKEG